MQRLPTVVNRDYTQNPTRESVSTMAILRRLECCMADLVQPYDEFAAHYDQIFEDWEASIARQAPVLAGIIDSEYGHKKPIRVLDCACGIVTEKAA
jgi:hypothetical protein